MHGIQLTRGPHAGRLAFGINTETWNGSRFTANRAALFVSDDGGDHWKAGATDSWPVAEVGLFRQRPAELHIGQRMGSRAFFTGAIDDIHV